MPGIRVLHFMRAAMDLLPAWCSQTAMQVTVRLYGDESPSILGLLPNPQWWFTPTSPRKCRRSVKLSQPWGQRNAYEPQKGIEVDALGALSAAHIGINMVKPG
jgi:hypothetical protein